MSNKTLLIHPSDNIEVALTNLYKDEVVKSGEKEISIKENVTAKHKFAVTQDILEGGEIIMYGVLVGKAVKFIPEGGLISTSNIKHASNSYKLGERKTSWHKPDVAKWNDRTFMGFHRQDGSVGTANHWLVIPLVFCENKNVSTLEEAFMKALGYKPKQSPYQSFVQKISEHERIIKSGRYFIC